MLSSTHSRHSNSSQHKSFRHSSSRNSNSSSLTSVSSHQSSSRHSKNSLHSSDNTLVHAQSLVHRISSDQKSQDLRAHAHQQEVEQRDGIIGAYKSRIRSHNQCLRGFRGKIHQQESRIVAQAEALRRARRVIRRLREDKAENEEKLARAVGMGQRERRARVEMQERYNEEFKLMEEEVKSLEEACEEKGDVIRSTKERFEGELREQRKEHTLQLAAKDDAFKSAQADFDRALTEKDSHNHHMARRFIAEKIAFEAVWNEAEEWKRRDLDNEEQLRIAGRQIPRHRLSEEEACEIHERYQRWLDKRDEVFVLRDRELGEMRERAGVLWRENGRLTEEIGRQGRRRRGIDNGEDDRQSRSCADDGSGIKIQDSNGRNMRLIDPRDMIRWRVRR